MVKESQNNSPNSMAEQQEYKSNNADNGVGVDSWNNNKPKKKSKEPIIFVLIVIILLLSGSLYYQYDLKKQEERNAQIFQMGANYAVNFILDQVSQQGYVEITYGNQSVILVQGIQS